MDERTCTKCSEAKPLDAFPLRRPGVYRRDCKACVAEYNRQYRAANAQRLAELARQWRSEHRENLLEGKRQWYAENRIAALEKSRNWRERNRDRKAEYDRALYEANRETRLAQMRKWRAANPDYMREWYAADSERAAINNRRRRARLAAVESHPYTARDVVIRSCGICGICGLPVDLSIAWPEPFSKSIDHNIPLSRGGADHLGNIQLAHLVCNLSKGDRLLPRTPENN